MISQLNLPKRDDYLCLTPTVDSFVAVHLAVWVFAMEEQLHLDISNNFVFDNFLTIVAVFVWGLLTKYIFVLILVR